MPEHPANQLHNAPHRSPVTSHQRREYEENQMKTLVSSILILGLISAAPAFAEKPDWAGKGQATAEQAQAKGEAMQQKGQGAMQQKKMQHKVQAGQGEMQQQMQKKAQGGQGEMNQERHKKLEKKQVGKETGKGSAEGKSSGPKQEKKWWKFWGE
ncbi:MAG: hypothetical protein ABFS39_08755 [Pseudomonadota bacterium]